ncbi:MAG: acyltransferase family protein, partial [Bacteroidales bacterium]|nr:acyltransferase family protein [Bacteroidales bacterium]
MALVGQRDSFFDGLKFVLITLVVLGHSIGPVSTVYPLSVIYDFIYFFHMPLFIFVSGYFTKKKDDLQSFWQSTLRLVETLLVFHVLSKFRFWITGGLSLSS